jgi:serine/threonine protein kinase/peptidoglycan hydrolase-like protein with peptidoglycan-binding domain
VEQEVRGALPPGTRLRGYEIVAVLGHGGFGITYRARDGNLDRDVAIKEYLPTALAVREDRATVLPRTTALADEFRWGRERFLDEARTLAKLEGAPAIVRVYDYLEANGTAYMVMALLDGESLARRLGRDGTLSQMAVERLFHPLLDGLEAVHAAGFLHRDIKPDNIIVDARGAPTLIDFGAARASMAGRSTPLTAIFTPGFAAGEQFTSAKQGPWTDIYGLSATLYCAITGRSPPSAFERMVHDTYDPLARLAPAGLSPRLLAAIDAGLGLRATDRPQSIAEWRAMLGSVSTPQAAPPVRSRRAVWIGAAAAALILVLAGGVYWQTTPRPSAPVVAAAPAPTQEEAATLRAEAAAREKAEQQAAVKRQVEEETRLRFEAEQAEKKRIETEVRQRLEAEATAKREEEARKPAEAGERALNLSTLDRKHVQAALIALGYGVAFTDGNFASSTRDMIKGYQTKHGEAATGFLTGPQFAVLMREAATAVTQFDEEQKKLAANPPLENDKRVNVTLAQGKCENTQWYVTRVYSNKLELMFRGGWQSFEANADGDFTREFTSPITGNRLVVRGNLRTRALSVENLRARCVWSGSF